MLTKKEIESVENILSQKPKTVIVSHHNPDGDAVGSSLALYHFFKNEGFDVTVILPNPFPKFLKWMPGADQILIADRHARSAARAIKEAELLCVADMNAAHRAGDLLKNHIADSKAFKLLIDHHLLVEIDCDAKLSVPGTSSTCELVYDFIFKYLKRKNALTKEMAECLYSGIITDTGSLSHVCNSPRIYQILTKLMQAGIDGEDIHRKIYDNYSENRMRLLGFSLSQRMKVLPQFATSYIYLTKEDLKNFHFQPGDTEGFVNYGLSMDVVRFTAFFTERDGRIRISFRSKGDIDVSKFAREYFDGGGHHNASAAYHYDTLENTIAYFEELVRKHADILHP